MAAAGHALAGALCAAVVIAAAHVRVRVGCSYGSGARPSWLRPNQGDDAIAIGHSVTAEGYNSTSVGVRSVTSGQGGSALGNSAKAKGLRATALGTGAQALGDASVALGEQSVASRPLTVSVAGRARSARSPTSPMALSPQTR